MEKKIAGIERLDGNTKRWILVAAFALIGILSFTVVGSWASSPEKQSATIEKLDEKKETVLRLSAAATATAVTITLIPGDAATPVADQIAEMTKYFLLILCAVYLEKYALTTMGAVSFKLLIPIAMVLFIIYMFRKEEAIKRMAIRITVFAVAFYFVIPCSVYLSSKIEESYKATMDENIKSVESVNEEISSQAEEDAALEEAREGAERSSILDGIRGIGESISEMGQSVITNISRVSSETLEKLKTSINHFIEMIAVMIITSCVIPVLVLLAIIYMAKTVLNNVVMRLR